MTHTATGPDLLAIRKELGATATELGRAMGYLTTQPHARVLQIEAQHTVSPAMTAKYLDGIARLRAEKEKVA